MTMDDHGAFANPNDYTRQFIPPPRRPSPTPAEDWAEWSAKMDAARRIRDSNDAEDAA